MITEVLIMIGWLLKKQKENVTREKVEIIRERWEEKDREVITEFSEPEKLTAKLEDLLEQSVSLETIKHLVEIKSLVEHAYRIADEYGVVPVKGKKSAAGKLIDERFNDIYATIMSAEQNVVHVKECLDNLMRSYVSALELSFRTAKDDYKHTSGRKKELSYREKDLSDRGKDLAEREKGVSDREFGMENDLHRREKGLARMKMDNVAMLYSEFSFSVGFYAFPEYKHLRRFWLNRHAKKVQREGTHKWKAIEGIEGTINETSAAAQYWNTKKPERTIFYEGRALPNGQRISADVRLFVTPNDGYIQEAIDDERDSNGRNLNVRNPNRCNDEIMRIYRHTRKYFEYEDDQQIAGVPEYWLFPFELRATGKGDCDDWANELASYLIGAGVPNYRVRVVCGQTRSGGGHSTLYVLGDNQKTWYHLNSTTALHQIPTDRLESMPTSKDVSDKMGIGEVWFSYNNEHAWHVFEGNAEQSFRMDKRSGVIKGI
ncbi:transglutaminase-like cysteine peptidase [Candidatus Woesearchaeota archaeon]|nr:transglutaminase-like cysteine peptidase [Candidatus Woesearchaeota archaeon]